MADDPIQPSELPAVVKEHPARDDDFTRQLAELLQTDPELKAISPQKRERLLTLSRAAHTEILAKYHSGPLPSPEDLMQYNEAVPNGADRIMVMAEKQSAHRIEIESLVIRSQQDQSGKGQIFGLIIGLFGISAGAAVACLGHDTVGGVIAGTTVVSLVSAFIAGKQQQGRNLSQKRESLPKSGKGDPKTAAGAREK